MAVSPETLIEAATTCGLLEPPAAARLRDDLRSRRPPDPAAAIARACRAPLPALYRALAEARGLRFLEGDDLSASPEAIARVPELVMRRKQVLPVAAPSGEALVATADPDDKATVEAVGRLLGRPVRAAIAEPEALARAIERALAGGTREGAPPAAAATGAAPPLEARATIDPTALLDDLLREAITLRASDLHLEPLPHALRVRFRIDGHLRGRDLAADAEAAQGVVSRVKVLAGLDIAERRAPQDGGLRYSVPGESAAVEVRVATAPTIHGERATLRLLGLETEALTLDALGFSEGPLGALRAAIARPSGMVLVTGPTGSGKTTTLYAALREVARPDLNVLTVEDPVEFAVPGVSQIQVDTTGKVSFAKALRALLRHDPDVLMVGEIRDRETADTALRASMTGHLVLSTLHTQTALGAVSRLVDLGCEPFLVAETLALSLAQRLVRRLCRRCRKERPARPEEAALLSRAAPAGDGAPRIFDHAGCAGCLGLGFRGRTAIAEALHVTRPLAAAVARRAPEEELGRIAAEGPQGFTTLRADGMARVLEGATTLAEVLDATVEA